MTEDWRNRTAKYADELLHLAERLYAAPEPAYQEGETVSVWAQFAVRHNLRYRTALDGRAPLISIGDDRKAATRIALAADLDAVGVSHAQGVEWRHLCGHHAQSTAALGALLLLAESGIPEDLAVTAVGCPAEECKPAFIPDCDIPFIPGKVRLLSEGVFSRITAVLSIHLADALPQRAAVLAHGAHGGLWLRIPSDQPAQQVLDAAGEICGGCAISMNITPFSSSEYDLRVETAPHAGEAAPRGRQIIAALQQKAIRASLVAEYAPLIHEEALRKLARRVLGQGDGTEEIERIDALWLEGMTDLGDVSQIIPTLQVFVGGTAGITHQSSFTVTDPNFSYVWPAWFLAEMTMAVHGATAKE